MIDLNVYSKPKMIEQFYVELKRRLGSHNYMLLFFLIDTSIYTTLLEARDPCLSKCIFARSIRIDNGEGTLLDFLHAIGEVIGEISKSSSCIFKFK